MPNANSKYQELLKNLLKKLINTTLLEKIFGLNKEKTEEIESAIFWFAEHLQKNKNEIKIEDLNQILELTNENFTNYILKNTFLLENGINQIFKLDQKDKITRKLSNFLSNLKINVQNLAPDDQAKQNELNTLKIDILLLKKHQNLTENENSELKNLLKNTENFKTYQERINYLDLLNFDVILKKLDLSPIEISEKINMIKTYFEKHFCYKLNENRNYSNQIKIKNLNLSNIIFDFLPKNLTDFQNQFKANILEKINNLNHDQFSTEITSKDEEFLSFLIINLFENPKNREEILDVFYAKKIANVILNFENYQKNYQKIGIKNINEKFINLHQDKNFYFFLHSLGVENIKNPIPTHIPKEIFKIYLDKFSKKLTENKKTELEEIMGNIETQINTSNSLNLEFLTKELIPEKSTSYTLKKHPKL